MIDDERSARIWLRTFPEYDDVAEFKLEQLVALLVAENAQQNLVSETSLKHVWQRHVVDSAQLLMHVPRGTGASWLDLGTGAGFPGLVISILRPETEIAMVESRPKRAAWLKRVCATLALPCARVIESRIELVDTQKFSVISARAFAPLDRLLKLSARFSDPETLWLLPKGRSAAHELQTLTGWQHMFHVEQSLTDREAGLIVGRLNGKTGHSR